MSRINIGVVLTATLALAGGPGPSRSSNVMEAMVGDQAVSSGRVERGLMKAVVLSRYGSLEGLEVREVEKPDPSGDEVLVRVHASSINDWEAAIVAGRPYFVRIFTGLLRPKIRIMGCDVSGTVEAVGASAHRFRPGDAVYGDIHGAGFGAYVEYVCVNQSALEKKPANLTFEQAAAVPHGIGEAAWTRGHWGRPS